MRNSLPRLVEILKSKPLKLPRRGTTEEEKETPKNLEILEILGERRENRNPRNNNNNKKKKRNPLQPKLLNKKKLRKSLLLSAKEEGEEVGKVNSDQLF